MDGLGGPYEIVETEYRGHGAVLASAAAAEGWDLVVAVGGDGTANEVGKGVMGTTAALGVVPAGSGNALARFLGIPAKPDAACRILHEADIRTLDVGRIANDIFISSAGIGLDAHICRRFNGRPGGRRGLTPYLITGLQALMTFEPVELRIVLSDGRTFETCPAMVTLSNTGCFGNGVTIAPAARPDDGLLDVCIVQPRSVLQGMWDSRRLFTGTIDRIAGFDAYQTTGCRIECSEPPLYQIDGEEVQADTSTLEVSIAAQALRVAVPA